MPFQAHEDATLDDAEDAAIVFGADAADAFEQPVARGVFAEKIQSGVEVLVALLVEIAFDIIQRFDERQIGFLLVLSRKRGEKGAEDGRASRGRGVCGAWD